MGRPTKLTPELMSEIVSVIEDGNAGEVAAESLGVSRTSFYEWMARGETEPDTVFADFADAVTRARARAEVFAVKALRTGMDQDWRAAEAYLKRARWKTWEPSQHVEVRVGPLEQLSDEELEKKALEKLQSVTLMLRGKDDE